jgi:hypothetical protein
MFNQYKKEKLNPETTTSSDNEITQAYNKAVKEGKLENVRLKDGRKIESEEDFRNYIDELNEDNNLATGGRAGFKSGSYLFTGLKDLGKKYKGSTLEAILENPKILGTEIGYEGIAEILRLSGMMQDGGRVGLKDGFPSKEENLRLLKEELKEIIEDISLNLQIKLNLLVNQIKLRTQTELRYTDTQVRMVTSMS